MGQASSLCRGQDKIQEMLAFSKKRTTFLRAQGSRSRKMSPKAAQKTTTATTATKTTTATGRPPWQPWLRHLSFVAFRPLRSTLECACSSSAGLHSPLGGTASTGQQHRKQRCKTASPCGRLWRQTVKHARGACPHVKCPVPVFRTTYDM